MKPAWTSAKHHTVNPRRDRGHVPLVRAHGGPGLEQRLPERPSVQGTDVPTEPAGLARLSAGSSAAAVWRHRAKEEATTTKNVILVMSSEVH